MTDRQIGGEGLTVDVRPPLVGERQAGIVGLKVEYTYPQGVQFGSLLAQLGAVPSDIARRVGNFGVMVDYVTSAVAANAARWSGVAFEMGTSSPLAYWSGSAFDSSGSQPVLWVTDHFEVSP